MSSAMGARVRPFCFGVSASEACSAPTDEKSSAVLRHCSTLIGSNEWLSSACASSVSNGGAPPRGAKGTFGGGGAAPAGGRRPFRRVELSKLVAVEFAVRGKGDVIDVEVEPHANGVGSDQVFDVTGLVERDLRIARARAQRPQHHRSAAALASDQLGDGIDFFGRERDDSGAAGKPKDPLILPP